MTIAAFPHQYSVTQIDNLLDAAPRPPILVGAPPQFGGTDDVWSPEHLLVASVASCLKSTFDAFAKREHVSIHTWRCTALGTLVKGKQGPAFDRIALAVEILVDPGDEARVQSLVATAESHCLVSRALVAPVVVTSVVRAVESRAAG